MEIEWDDDNVEHLARHGISPDEVKETLVLRFAGAVAPTRPIAFGYWAARQQVDILPLSIKRRLQG